MGYMRAGRDAMRKRLTEIADIRSNLADYDLVVVGTPIWGWTVTPAVRTFLAQNCNWIQKIAFFCTMGGSGDEKAFNEMAKISEKDPVATLTVLTKEVNAGGYAEKITAFAKYIINKTRR
jgi:multimeric flavodoxin WrbA